jgi:hypothetical protein
MKKHILLLLLGFLATSFIFAQVLSEDFENWPPENWVLEPATGNGAWLQNNGDVPTAGGNAGPGSAFEGEFAAMYNNYDYNPGIFGSMTTPSFDISGLNTPMVQFFWWNNDAPLEPALIIVQASSNGSIFVTLDTIEAKQSGEDWVEYYHLLDANISYIKIVGVSDYGLKNTYIDAFSIVEAPDCLQPNSLSVIESNPNSVTIDWIPGNDEQAWVLEYGLAGFEQGTGIELSVNEHPYTIENLNSNTNYEVYLQSDCGDEFSPWTEALAFSTTCEVIDMLPWEEGFENDNLGCFQVQQFNPVETWYWTNDLGFLGPQAGEGYARISYSLAPQDEWMISPVFDFTYFQPTQLVFWWALNYNLSVIEDSYDLEVKVTTDGNQWTTVWDETMAGEFESWEYQEAIIDMWEYSDASYFQFAFVYTGIDGAAAYLDEVALEMEVGINNQNTNAESILISPNPSSTFLRIHSQNPIEQFDLYDMCGKQIETVLVSGDKNFEWSTSHLKPGSYLLKVETTESLVVESLIIQ